MQVEKRLLIFLIMLLSLTLLQGQSQKLQNTESFSLAIEFEQIGQKNFTALYNDLTNEIYLPIQDIFEFLKIHHESLQDGKNITGFIQNEKNTYQINSENNTITYKGSTLQTNNQHLIYDLGILYLSSKIWEETFGFKIEFNFRALSATMGADFEFPLVRYNKLELARSNLKHINGITHYDDSIARKYHMFRFGMVDWSISAMQGLRNENRIGIAAGAEILGGEASVWLNYSDVFGLNRNQQRYYWRWVNNQSRIIRQLQVGRIYNTTIASLLNPVDGISITNAPTTVRKALGSYQITDHTSPDWLVELYINNVLVDYTTADASGFFRFEVPITYGSTNIMLRYYGPNGEEQSEERNFNMPYNFLPAREFEYRLTAGYVLNELNSRYGRAEVNYGITKGITVGAGMEYSGTIAGNSPYIPFLTASLQPLNRLLVIGEYAHQVRTKVMLNYTLPGNSIIELNHARFDKDQTAIIFNYLEENAARISVPFAAKKYSGFARGGFRQFNYSNFSYNSGEASISAFMGRFNANLSNFISWTTVSSPFVFSHLSLGYRLPKNLNIRGSAQYNFTNNRFISYKAEIEKQLFHRGMLTAGYENNLQSGFNSINIGFRYDFSFMSAFSSANFTNNRIISSLNARGSLAFGSGNKYIHADRQNAVGRSGVSVHPFIDVNHDGVMNDDEPLAENMHVRAKGGQMIVREKDNIIRLTGLEPFVEYGLILDETGLENLALQISEKNILITTDPNQFKKIEVPVTPMGEVYGTVVQESDEGIGRILLNIINDNDSLIARTQSESDGFFSYLGLKPGNYCIAVDTTQLRMLNMYADVTSFVINPSVDGDMVNVGKIQLRKRIIQAEDSLVIDTLANERETKFRITKEFNSPVLFDFDKSEIRAEVKPYLTELADALKQNRCIKLQIEAHTCSIGSDSYNMRLSERRGRSVMNFLVNEGVTADRLSIKAYGERKPMYDNRTKAERALNRRVTFKDLSSDECEPEMDIKFSKKTNSSDEIHQSNDSVLALPCTPVCNLHQNEHQGDLNQHANNRNEGCSGVESKQHYSHRYSEFEKIACSNEGSRCRDIMRQLPLLCPSISYEENQKCLDNQRNSNQQYMQRILKNHIALKREDDNQSEQQSADCNSGKSFQKNVFKVFFSPTLNSNISHNISCS